jgi:hypothetical protein
MDFSSRQLRAFHLVARHRSFARAAEEFLITSSGLTLPLISGKASLRSDSNSCLTQMTGRDVFRMI